MGWDGTYIFFIPLKGLIYFILQGHVRARTEIVPDQRERYLQKFQQVQQQGQSALLNMPSFPGGNPKQFSSQQQNPLFQQVSFFCIFFLFFTLNLNNEDSLRAKILMIHCVVRKLKILSTL